MDVLFGSAQESEGRYMLALRYEDLRSTGGFGLCGSGA